MREIDDARLSGETPLEQARIVQLKLLDVFVRICDEHNLRYWLDYGTLLGAMRHDGFIPWDDDLDVSMPLMDYKKFLKIAPALLPRTVLLQDLRKTPGACFSFAKLRDRSSFFCEAETVVSVPCGIFIDIFPWICAPRLPRRLINWWCHFQYSCLRHAGAALARPRANAGVKMVDCCVSLGWKAAYWLAYAAFSLMRVLFPSKAWRGRQDSYSTYYVEEERLFPLRRHIFVEKEYNVPCDADYVLRKEYGDWRKLSPEEKRIYHATIISAAMTPPHVPWALE